MKLLSFQGTNLNGYLNFNFSFNEDLTFITGINGSGKTSALNAMSGLLMPRLDYLSSKLYDFISLSIEHNGEKVVLSAVQTDEGTALSCSLFPDETIMLIAFVEPDIELPQSKISELEQEYYKEMLVRLSKNPIIKLIEDLPTPMFLGLDRRSRTFQPDRYWQYGIRRRSKNRNIFGNTLSAGLREAMYFAQDRLRSDQRRKFSLDRNFRDKLVLELLNFPPVNFSVILNDNESVDEKKLKDAKTNIYKIPELLGLEPGAVVSRIENLFTFIEQQIKVVKDSKEVQKLPIEKEDDDDFNIDDPVFEARYALAQNKNNIDKINTLSEMVSEYNQTAEIIDKRVTEFIGLVNSFLLDSGKSISFNDELELVFRLSGSMDERDISTLSSGEIQLIVIFAHLYFNPETNKANVFIIDEPELSLHVQWQQKFVDSLLLASSNIQFVMATHSPTVIIGRVDRCKEISQIK